MVLFIVRHAESECIVCYATPLTANPCPMCCRLKHRFHGGLKEIVFLSGRPYAITGKGVMKYTGGRWRDGVIDLLTLKRRAECQ